MKGSDAVHDFLVQRLKILLMIFLQIITHLNELLITAGGSTHFIWGKDFQKLNSRSNQILLRSGCYITHDHGPYLDALETAKSDPMTMDQSRKL